MLRYDQFLKGLNYARDASRSVAQAIVLEEKRSLAKIDGLQTRLQENKDALGKILTGPKWAKTRIGSPTWSAVHRRLFKKAMNKLNSERETIDLALQSEITKTNRKKAERIRFVDLARTLAEHANQPAAAAAFPEALKDEIKSVIRDLSIEKNRRKRDRERLYDLCVRLAAICKAAEQPRLTVKPVQEANPVPNKTAIQASSVAHSRIYLPIPYSFGYHAKKAGAHYDRENNFGGSGWYVPIGAPLAKFDALLPLSFRKSPPKLSFPPVRHKASNQNLWSIFDGKTWDHIRHINYQQSGKRCVLCGKQSGHLLRVLESNAESRIGGVDCHEIWEWSVPDPTTSVGVQTLKGLMVLCYECHMCFHEGFAATQARKAGVEDSVVGFLKKKRSLLTRLDPQFLEQQMRDEAARLRKHAGIKRWIMDLGHLGNQDYMRQVTPVFNEGNEPGVSAGDIAGLAFVTDTGVTYDSLPVKDLHSSLADLYRRPSVSEFTHRMR